MHALSTLDGGKTPRKAAKAAKSQIKKLYKREETDDEDDFASAAENSPTTSGYSSARRRARHDPETAPADDSDSADSQGSQESGGNAGNINVVPPVVPPVMADFEDENGTDGDKALEKVGSVKIAWDPQDLKFFFIEIEDAMDLIQIKSQWLKRQVLSTKLPGEVKAEVKDILIKKKSEAGTDIYKQLKLRLLELFGPKSEDAYEEAASLVLTGKPSALCKRMIVLLCDSKKPLQGCCCVKTISALWKKQLTPPVRAAVAGMDMAKDLDAVLRKADDVHASQAVQQFPVAAVTDVNLDETLPALQAAAITTRRSGAGGQKPKKNRGDPHPDGPPETACYLHWRYGRSAYTCKKKSSCPWKSFTKPKPKPDSA